ncbi:MAG: GNAT family N-acetyltransferase [Kangiellaceae bacterium]|nr:GNAT family N-acetyltransferase [Kangiellaceae bacterium]
MNDSDVEFIFDLYNQPSFKENIGERGIDTLEDAANAIRHNQHHYTNLGYWLYTIELNQTGEQVGINGLVKREQLEHPDIGFAFLPQFWRLGYAHESSLAILDHAKNLSLKTVLAITSPQNQASQALIRKLGFESRGQTQLDENDTVNLFRIELTT